MPDLKCTVQSCVHNHNFYCDLDKIVVGGEQAKKESDTCCESFQVRRGEGYSNDVTGYAAPETKIDCKATKCMYNEKCNCYAGKISVEGGNACTCDQTECATFHQK